MLRLQSEAALPKLKGYVLNGCYSGECPYTWGF